MSFGKKLSNLRKEKGLTQKELGQVLGFSARTISDWENNNTEPNMQTIKKLVNLFEITYDEFFEDAGTDDK